MSIASTLRMVRIETCASSKRPLSDTNALALRLPIVTVMLMSLLNLANHTAFSVIILTSTFSLYQFYLIAITCILLLGSPDALKRSVSVPNRLRSVAHRGKVRPSHERWRFCASSHRRKGHLLTRLICYFQAPSSPLGRLGIPINSFAIIYSSWLGIFMVFRNYLPITAAYMNSSLSLGFRRMRLSPLDSCRDLNPRTFYQRWMEAATHPATHGNVSHSKLSHQTCT